MYGKRDGQIHLDKTRSTDRKRQSVLRVLLFGSGGALVRLGSAAAPAFASSVCPSIAGMTSPAAKREQRSIRAKSLFAALSDIRLCGHVSGVAAWPYVSRSLLAAPEEGHDLRSGAIR
ncbi:hypothetical protein, partial [uncultured Agathobaculum sp.]|uniref:hypothetical protein n=1 Tax=uncultured Agathobaculum sp. TaxID=2048140 RepID=UPI00296FD62A